MEIGFIGTGNMGSAMLKGASKLFEGHLYCTDHNLDKMELLKKDYKIDFVMTPQELIDSCDIVVLAVKPQSMADLLMPLKWEKEKILISIAAGITIETLRAYVQGSPKIVRAMPNTPALVGQAMSAVTFSEDFFTAEEEEMVMKLFNAFGKAVKVKENQMDAVVAVSGSSPAYVFMIIEAMADAAVLQGLPRKMAYEMAAQSMLGSASMVLETGLHPGVLKDQVCSPGGTTIEAVRTLEDKGLRSAMIEAMNACYNKSANFNH